MVNAWRDLPHVAQWWDQEDVFDAEDLRDPKLSLNIVFFDDTPIGFQQSYSVHGWDFTHHFEHFPPGTRGIDQFIGPDAWIGRGHGSAFVRTYAEVLLANGAPFVATDPHPKNGRAIRCYEKAGFNAHGPVLETEWGPILPMSRKAPTP